MKRFSKLIGVIVVFVAVMAAFCTVSFAATIGQQLNNPETGWQRFNDNNPLIIYKNFNYAHMSQAGNYKENLSYSTLKGAKIQFSFYGTKLRIVGQNNTSKLRTADGLIITIDNVPYYYSEIGTSQVSQILEFEITGLSLGTHKVLIERKTDDLKFITLDAIDVEEEGYLVNVNTPSNLTTTPGNKKVDLYWNYVEGVTSYNIKRSTTPGGPYTTIATNSEIKYTDTNVVNGTTYYYVVSAVKNGTESSNSNEVPVTVTKTIQLKLVLEKDEQKQLSVSDDLSDNTELTWTSSDSTIATVDENGKVKALKPGNTVITCASEDKSYTENINVLVVDLEYQLAVDLAVGDKCRLTIDDLANTTNVIWLSYDTSIANVSAKGKVTAISEGLTYIVASDKDGNELGRIYIRVRQLVD